MALLISHITNTLIKIKSIIRWKINFIGYTLIKIIEGIFTTASLATCIPPLNCLYIGTEHLVTLIVQHF